MGIRFYYFCLFAYLFVPLSAKKNVSYETDIDDIFTGWGDDRHSADKDRDKVI